MAHMTEDERRARRVDLILRRLGVAPRKRRPTDERRDHGPVWEGDGRSIHRVVGRVLRVR